MSNQNSADPPDELAAARRALVSELRAEGITDARVLAALGTVRREEFVGPGDRRYAYVNEALPIAGGQTISQPYIVALMSELLELHGGERVFEVGTGSGYQAAVLATLVGEVYSVEIDPLLADTARQRLHRLGYGNVHIRSGDGFYGWEEAAPFDAIIITAAAPRIPERLIAQLKAGGRLVMPLDERGREVLIRARKGAEGLTVERFGEVAFVPMRGAVRTPTP
jgi:protein-L-isoaspartate(D-aspartate) O-methyltransferase